jgi:hypothetical protein
VVADERHRVLIVGSGSGRKMSMLHAHVSRSSADCDGPTYQSNVVTFNEEEMAEHADAEAAGGWNNFSDISFMNRVFCTVAGPYAVEQAIVTISESGFEYSERTEEGYRHAEVRWCRHDCDTDETSYRDVYAEQMGY